MLNAEDTQSSFSVPTLKKFDKFQ